MDIYKYGKIMRIWRWYQERQLNPGWLMLLLWTSSGGSKTSLGVARKMCLALLEECHVLFKLRISTQTPCLFNFQTPIHVSMPGAGRHAQIENFACNAPKPFKCSEKEHQSSCCGSATKGFGLGKRFSGLRFFSDWDQDCFVFLGTELFICTFIGYEPKINA